MTFRSFIPVLVLVAASCGETVGHTSDEEADVEGEQDLSATPPRPEALTSVVWLFSQGCTATRVGPRHLLTAAHCVTVLPDVGPLKPAFQPGAELYLANGRDLVESPFGPGTENVRRVIIERTELSPKWREELARSGIQHDSPGAEGPPDAALVVLTEKSAQDLNAVGISPIDLGKPATGSSAYVAGYGCNGTIINRTLAVHPRKLSSADALVKQGLLSPDSAERTSRSYHYTLGATCNGDSGAPVFRRTSSGYTVIAVHSAGNELPGQVTVATETRLDARSRDDVGSWLASLGVASVGTITRDRFSPCRVFQGTAETDKSVCGALLEKFDNAGGERALGTPVGEARSHAFGAAWRWSQRFERGVLSMTSSGVRVDLAPDPCAGLGDGEYCELPGNEFDADIRKVWRCEAGRSLGRRFCAITCRPSETPGAVTCQ